MILEGILPYARTLLEKAVTPGDAVVDATMGNGHDTVFLANLVGEKGTVFAFDVQTEALKKTKERLEQHQLTDRVVLYHRGHEELIRTIPEKFHGKITAAIFNLGYLPGSDKSIVTKPKTTKEAVEQLLEIMAPGGVIVLVVYHGHEEGKREKDELCSFVRSIDQSIAHVLLYQFINQINDPPFIIALEKRNDIFGEIER
ncbi:class I SAM-dependent methyltransferase [Bacillus sp. FSL W8-0223]|uniref:class I SAM-dependent methyltransferase n=1 Tax=Bacillus TaxID=1386 RepID=UPI0030FA8A75